MPKKGEGKYNTFFEDPDFNRWFQGLARSSRATADNYSRIAGLFLRKSNLTPRGFAAMKGKRRDDHISDYIDEMLKAGKSGAYAAVVKKALVSWLDHNGKRLTRKIKIPNASVSHRSAEWVVPDQDVLRRVLDSADARGRAAIALMAFAGFREGVLGNYTGKDGLHLKDLPEMKIKGGSVEFEPVPARVVVRRELSKTGRAYFSFLGPEGCRYVAGYLQERLRTGEKLRPESPMFIARFYNPGERESRFIRSINISDIIRKPMRAAGVKEPPYIWRSYFASRAMMAESKGLLRDYRQFFMGHKGDIEHVYTMAKGFTADRIEAMRKAYAAALPYLETTPQPDEKSPYAEMAAMMLMAKGWSERKIADLELDMKSKQQIAEVIGRVLNDDPPVNGGNGGSPLHRVVSAANLPTFLDQGWLFKASLPDGRAVIENSKRPAA